MHALLECCKIELESSQMDEIKQPLVSISIMFTCSVPNKCSLSSFPAF